MNREIVKRIDMALHIQELCSKHAIHVVFGDLYYASRGSRTIGTRPTKNTGYYVSALHEIGHILGPQQTIDDDRLESEIGAWKYAMANAIVWTDVATKIMKRALMSYGLSEQHWQNVWNECLSYTQSVKGAA